jgi:hypothetical protein
MDFMDANANGTFKSLSILQTRVTEFSVHYSTITKAVWCIEGIFHVDTARTGFLMV